MKIAILSLLTLFALSSCATTPAVDLVQAEIDQVNVGFDDARVQTTTPWITEDLRAPASLTKTKSSLCAGAKNKKSCDANVRKQLHERIHERYVYSDRKALAQRCKKNVTACHNLKTYEAWARASHNTRLELLRKRRLDQLQQTRLARANPLTERAVYDHASEAYVVEITTN